MGAQDPGAATASGAGEGPKGRVRTRSPLADRPATAERVARPKGQTWSGASSPTPSGRGSSAGQGPLGTSGAVNGTGWTTTATRTSTATTSEARGPSGRGANRAPGTRRRLPRRALALRGARTPAQARTAFWSSNGLLLLASQLTRRRTGPGTALRDPATS